MINPRITPIGTNRGTDCFVSIGVIRGLSAGIIYFGAGSSSIRPGDFGLFTKSTV
jgi:hypothetical protein